MFTFLTSYVTPDAQRTILKVNFCGVRSIADIVNADKEAAVALDERAHHTSTTPSESSMTKSFGQSWRIPVMTQPEKWNLAEILSILVDWAQKLIASYLRQNAPFPQKSDGRYRYSR